MEIRADAGAEKEDLKILVEFSQFVLNGLYMVRVRHNGEVRNKAKCQIPVPSPILSQEGCQHRCHHGDDTFPTKKLCNGYADSRNTIFNGVWYILLGQMI